MSEPIPVNNLEQKLQSLPVELQDRIYDLTLFSFPDVIELTPSYHPPIGLDINHSIRDLVAQSFYSRVAFQITVTPVDKHIILLNKWLSSLPLQHRIYISTIRLYRPKWTPDNGFGRANSFALGELCDLRAQMKFPEIDVTVLQINSRAGDGETEEWWEYMELYQGKRKGGSGKSAVEEVTDGLRAGWMKK